MPYKNTLVTVAADCPVKKSEIPVPRGNKIPQHLHQYTLLTNEPYALGHEELTFEVYLRKEGLENESEAEKQNIWAKLFEKEHPCLRASSLTKRYGFGAHYNSEGKIAIYPMESPEYKKLLDDKIITKLPAMNSKRMK
jgi:hypothetical protein